MENASRGGAFAPATGAALLGFAAVGIGVAHWMDMLPETFTASLLAGAIVLTTTFAVLRGLVHHVQTTSQAVVAVVLTAALLAATAVPLWETLFPGTPLAAGSLRHTGDALALGDGAAGPVRLWVHGAIAGTSTARVSFELSGAALPVRGSLDRTSRNARVGRRGRTTVVKENNSMLIGAELPSSSHALSLSSVGGALAGGLSVSVFREWWPKTVGISLALIVLLATAVVCAVIGADTSTVGIAGLSLAFGAFVHDFATPDVLVRPQVGALILAGFGGTTAGLLVGWVTRRIALSLRRQRGLPS